MEYRGGRESVDGRSGGLAGIGEVEISVADTDSLTRDGFAESGSDSGEEVDE